MKKLAAIFVSVLLALSLFACVPDKSGENKNSTDSTYTELTQAEIVEVLPEIKSAFGSDDEVAVYGKYNGYYIVEFNSHSYLVVSEEDIGGVVFTFAGKPQTVHGYMQGELYELQELYADGKITHSDLLDIHQKHCNMSDYTVTDET